ncbi:low temperature requirement protein A [Agromyces sp. SYSU T0242]|uniref:low temperature requirement protein A n=1 Tax=Agromyces litoreus TaxID=3158561 RepID=UPI0033920CB9
MQERNDAGGGRRLIGRVRTADDTARVTTFELFFDLVYVFAFTQVSRLMAETHSGFGILQALIVLGLLWWTWCAYSWLANQAPADQGVVRIGMSAAMIAVFVIALAIPEAYEDLDGGWSGPLVLVIAYTVVRLIHMGLYLVAAGDDRALAMQVLRTQAVAMAPATILLLIGALVGGPAQTWIWLAAFLWDVALTYASSRGGGGWRIYSPGHWSERYGLIVILALGESIVAIGVGVAQEPIDAPITLGAALAVTLSILLWAAYFTRVAPAGEHELERRTDAARVVLARDAYTYAHFVIVAGIILAALGVEDAMAHVTDPEPFGWFGAAALGGGLAVYLLGTVGFARVVGMAWPWVRIATALVMAAASPLLAIIAPMAALLVVVAIVAVGLAVDGGRRGRTATAATT